MKTCTNLKMSVLCQRKFYYSESGNYKYREIEKYFFYLNIEVRKSLTKDLSHKYLYFLFTKYIK